MTIPSPVRGLGTIDRTTRRERILQRLREALGSGELPPGTHLAEVELSESLQVSRGTLREALRFLQRDGLVVADARGRLRVRALSPQDVREVFTVRAALETLAAELVCAQPDADRAVVVTRLRDALADLAALAVDGGIAQRVEHDLAFHETLCRASGNAVLLESWQHVRGLARASITAAGLTTAIANMAAERHRPIVEAVEQGDAASAREVIRMHMAGAADQIVAHLTER